MHCLAVLLYSAGRDFRYTWGRPWEGMDVPAIIKSDGYIAFY
jgi:hypothetical protein